MKERKQHPALDLLLVALILVGLIYGKDLLIPLVLALVVWYLINAIGAQFGKIQIGEKHPPRWLQTTLSVGVVVSFFWFVGRLVKSNLVEFAEVAPEYDEKIKNLSNELTDYLGTEIVAEITAQLDLASYATKVLNSSISFVSALLVVLFYIIFLFLEQNIFSKKLDLIFTHRKNKVQFFQTMSRIDDSMKTYMAVKSFISLLVALCTYIVLISFGVDFAILWAFLTFLLNFIPFVGSFIAICMPSLLALMQFDDPLIALAIFVILNSLQVLIGNYLEPRIVGKSLNLSPLVVVLALAFWGSIWDVAGMFLCVPITVAMMIVLSQFPNTRAVAILLSAGIDPSRQAKRLNVADQESQEQS